MLTAFVDGEFRQHSFLLFVFVFILFIRRICGCFGIHSSPSFIEDGAACGLERHTVRFSQYHRLVILAIRIEDGQETLHNQLIHFLLVLVQAGDASCLSRRDDGMVVGDLAIVKYALAL